MCGIFGALLFEDFNHQNKYKILAQINDLAIYNMTRGTHSTGIARIDALAEAPALHSIYKNVGPASEVSEHKEWKTTCSINPKTVAILGHTRFATHGEINIKNAHPFFVASLVGVHNGVVRNALRLHTQFEVDSEATLYHIGTNGESAIEDLSGSAALAYVKLDSPHQLNLYRDSNPIFIYINYKDRYLLFSSQENHLIATATPKGFQNHEILFELPQRRVINIDNKCKMTISKTITTMWGRGSHNYNYTGEEHSCATWHFGRTRTLSNVPLLPETSTTENKTDHKAEELFEFVINALNTNINITLEELAYICGVDSETHLLRVADNFFNPVLAQDLNQLEMACDVCGEASSSIEDKYNFIPNINIYVCEKCLREVQTLITSSCYDLSSENTQDPNEDFFESLASDAIETSWQDDVLEQAPDQVSNNWMDLTTRLGYTASDLFCKYCEAYLGDEPLGGYTARRNRFKVPICSSCAAKISSMENVNLCP